MPMASRVVARPSGRTAVARSLMALAVLAAAGALYVDLAAWPFNPFTTTSGGLADTLRPVQQVRLITFYAGLAARDAAGGRTARLVVPRDLDSLARPETKPGDLKPYSTVFLEQMSSGNLESRDYDPVLSDAQVRSLLEGRETVEYPMGVVAVLPDAGDGQAVLFTDERHKALYAVPLALLPGSVAQ